MNTYLDCWTSVAAALFAQALAGEPDLAESLPKPFSAGSFGFSATLAGDASGEFSVTLDNAILDSPLVGEGVDQKAGWAELLREVAEAAAGELLAATGHKCRVESFTPVAAEGNVSRAFQLTSGDRSWTILVCDEVHIPEPAARPAPAQGSSSAQPSSTYPSSTLPSSTQPSAGGAPSQPSLPPPAPSLPPGFELLLDIELDASLRFGCREMPLGEVLDLGPGDVVQLDRHVADPVDLIVGDKIVARGEVVLVNGSFGLRVTEVASPRRRLESIRCLF
jgi:flagellar motor switch protein FliN